MNEIFVLALHEFRDSFALLTLFVLFATAGPKGEFREVGAGVW